MDVPAHQHALGGRACKRDALVHHMFGVYSDEIRGHVLRPFTLLPGVRWIDPAPCAPRLWHIGADATEIIRNADDAVAPVSDQDFYQVAGPIAGGFRTQNVSLAKIMVTMQNYGGQHVFFMDANQSIEVYSDKISFDLLLPENFVPVTRYNRDDLVRGPGLVGDIKIGAYYFEIEGSRAVHEVRYTTFHDVLANTQSSIEVPPFARAATVYQTAAGGASVSWLMWAGDPTLPGIQLGTIPFIPGARKTEPGIELPSATHLQTDLDGADRFFTIHWTIRP